MDATAESRRDIIISIRPLYAFKIFEGHKTVELRRKFSEAAAIGVTAFIYASSPVSAIIGRARINHVTKLPVATIWHEHGTSSFFEG
jgi:predicted transcriptional regulator